MKKTGFKTYAIPALLIVVLVYNAIVFLVAKDYTKTFWLLYGFFVLGFVWFLLSSIFAKEGKTGIAYLHPTVTISGFFWVITFLFSLIFMWFPNMAPRAVLIPMIIITGIALVIYCFALMNKELIARENAQKVFIHNIGEVSQVLVSLSEKTRDTNVKRSLDELIVLSHGLTESTDEKINSLDKRIIEYVQFINKNLTRNEMNNIYNNINKVKSLLLERQKA